MMTDESLQIIVADDHDTDFEVRVHEVFELQLGAMPTTGHLWEFAELPDEVIVESFRWETREDADPYDTPAPAADTVRVWRMHTTSAGIFDVRLKCWQPWEGDRSIINTFAVAIEAS